jgi:hypothetical protein
MQGLDLNDNYQEAVARIYSAYILCCGGYYEPKSERDYQLSLMLSKLLEELAVSTMFGDAVRDRNSRMDGFMRHIHKSEKFKLGE